MLVLLQLMTLIKETKIVIGCNEYCPIIDDVEIIIRVIYTLVSTLFEFSYLEV